MVNMAGAGTPFTAAAEPRKGPEEKPEPAMPNGIEAFQRTPRLPSLAKDPQNPWADNVEVFAATYQHKKGHWEVDGKNAPWGTTYTLSLLNAKKLMGFPSLIEAHRFLESEVDHGIPITAGRKVYPFPGDDNTKGYDDMTPTSSTRPVDPAISNKPSTALLISGDGQCGMDYYAFKKDIDMVASELEAEGAHKIEKLDCPSLAEIEEKLKEMKAYHDAHPGETPYIFFSGHGGIDNKGITNTPTGVIPEAGMGDILDYHGSDPSVPQGTDKGTLLLQVKLGPIPQENTPEAIQAFQDGSTRTFLHEDRFKQLVNQYLPNAKVFAVGCYTGAFPA